MDVITYLYCGYSQSMLVNGATGIKMAPMTTCLGVRPNIPKDSHVPVWTTTDFYFCRLPIWVLVLSLSDNCARWISSYVWTCHITHNQCLCCTRVYRTWLLHQSFGGGNMDYLWINSIRWLIFNHSVVGKISHSIIITSCSNDRCVGL